MNCACFEIKFYVIGKDAETSFKNLRNRYSRDKKKIKAARVSGTDTNSVTEVKDESSEMYSFLSWLDPYVQPRSSASNLVELDDSAETDDISDETVGDISDTDIKSKVTGRVQNTKRARNLLKENPVDKAEMEIIKKIGERLVEKGKSEVDEDSLFGQLIASQLKKIPTEERLITKMEINNVIYSHLLKNNAGSQSNQNCSLLSGSFSSVNQVFPGMANHPTGQLQQQSQNMLPNEMYQTTPFPSTNFFLNTDK